MGVRTVPHTTRAPRLTATGRPTRRGDGGFTLVEIVIAIVVVGVLSAVVVVGVGRMASQGTEAACTASLDAARAAATAHLAVTGTYPTTFTELEASGSMTRPDGATIDPAGTTLSTADWSLRLLAGTPPTFACSGTLPVPGAVAQYDASNTASVETATVCTTARRWVDRSGNGFHLDSFPSAATGISWSATALGGRPAVTTDGSAVLRNTWFSMSQGSVFVVARMTGGTNQRILSGWHNNWLLGWWSGLQDAAYFGNWLSGPAATATTNALLYSATMQPGVRATAWRNGVQVRTDTSGSATSTPWGLVVGGAHSLTSEYSAAAVSEVIVYDRVLDDTERQQTERYLADKWGLTVTGSAVPSMAPSPRAWFDASVEADLLPMAQACVPNVAAWRSSVGSGVLVPRNGAIAATLDPTGFGGRPAIVTNGENNLVQPSLSLPGDATVFAVAAPRVNASRIISSTGNNWLLGWWGAREHVAHFDGWVASWWTAPAVMPASGPHLYSAVIDRGVRADVFADGAPLMSSTSATTTPVGLSIGGWASSEFTNAAVAEVIIYDRALTTDERRAVESYLAAKWGLTLSG